MGKIIHVLGNGDKAELYRRQSRDGMTLLCNLPPFEVDRKKVFGTCMVDFKMMSALTEGSINLDTYPWILGTRPKIWMEQKHAFYLKYAPNVKEFYTVVPKYAGNATNFNCGHMAVHYAANRHNADEVHMYGFDTLFDFNMRSVTDTVLSSDRSQNNNYRLLNNWRPIWSNIFKQFPNTKFVLHHNHDQLKIKKLDNIEIVQYNDKMSSAQMREDESDFSGNEPVNRKQRRAQEAQKRKAK